MSTEPETGSPSEKSGSASEKSTEVGSVFVSNYPPFSTWESDATEELRVALGSAGGTDFWQPTVTRQQKTSE